jgi:hypothetical protein
MCIRGGLFLGNLLLSSPRPGQVHLVNQQRKSEDVAMMLLVLQSLHIDKEISLYHTLL